MEFEKVFITLAVVLVGVIAIFGIGTNLGNTYGVNDVGSSMNSTTTHVQNILSTTLANTSQNMGNSTLVQSGSGTTSTTSELFNRGIAVLGIIPSMIALVPALLNDAAIAIGIPAVYASIATAVFLFCFSLLFAYLLIIGVRRFV